MADRSVTFDIIGRDRASQAFKSAGESSGKLHGKLSALGGFMAGGLAAAATGAAAGLAAVGGWLVQGVKDAASYQSLQSKTEAVLKSTGNAARTSVPHIQALAGQLESLSGVDEELIINSQNVLATFTAVQNGAGKGNDVFDQATKAALNMSSALGTDLQGATVQVGKALNDPIKGVTALQRSGVSFTAQQRDQIKALVESGDTMGAQKLILAELNKEFGGAAEAAGKGFAGSLARAKDALGDAGRAVGAKLLPHVTRLSDWVATKGIPGVQRLIGEFRTKFGPTMDKIGGMIRRDIIPAFQKAFSNPDVQNGLKKLGALVVIAAGAFAVGVATSMAFSAALVAAVGYVTNKVGPAFRWLADKVLDAVGAIVHGAASAFGWVPGIGDKLKAAESDFDKFRQSVNQSLNGIHDRNVNVYVRTKSGVLDTRTDALKAGSNRRAMGGPVVAGQSYLVGENGPEVVTFGSSGYVTPNHRLSSAGGTVINVHGFVGSPAQLRAALADAVRRGGNSGGTAKFA